MDDLWCKVYLRPKAMPNDLTDFVCQLIDGTPTNVRSVENATLVIDVMKNQAGSYLSADFVDWPHYLDIEPKDTSVGRAEFVAHVGDLLRALRTRDVEAVPACSFESELK